MKDTREEQLAKQRERERLRRLRLQAEGKPVYSDVTIAKRKEADRERNIWRSAHKYYMRLLEQRGIV